MSPPAAETPPNPPRAAAPRSAPRDATCSRTPEPYLPLPNALAVTLATPAGGGGTAAVKQCGRKAGRLRSRRARGRAHRVFAERTRAAQGLKAGLRWVLLVLREV